MYVTKKERDVMVDLFVYRGLRAKDVAALKKKSVDITTSEEKSTYNILRRLQRKGLVNRMKNVECDHSIYYLSLKGFEYVKSYLNVPYGVSGNGLLPINDDTILWDMPYSIYTPPRYQLRHYLMTVDCLIALLPLYNRLRVQTAYYCNLPYTYEYKSYKIKPDLALTLDDKYYAVEVDTGTESKQQLTAKFTKYKKYADYAATTDVKAIYRILFVVNESTQNNLNRRWITILEAFYTAFGEDINPSIHLIFVTLPSLVDTLQLELQRQSLLDYSMSIIGQRLISYGYSEILDYKLSGMPSVKVYLNPKSKMYRPTYSLLNHPRETKFYYDKYAVYTTQCKLRAQPMPIEEHYGFRYAPPMSQFMCLFSPYVLVGLNKSNLSEEFINKLEVLPQLSDKYAKLDEKG